MPHSTFLRFLALELYPHDVTHHILQDTLAHLPRFQVQSPHLDFRPLSYDPMKHLKSSGWWWLQPDVTFEAVEALQPMARLVYGLLRSPVLTQAAKHHPDLHTALRLLWTGLPPSELRRAVYPLLSSYTTPDEQVRCPSQ